MSIFCKLRLLYIMVFISLVFSIISLCRTLPRSCDNLGFDYMGVIVAIFSLLVTILIGWNIYTALDIGKEMKIIKNEQSKIKEQLKTFDEKVNDTSYYCEGTVFFNQGLFFYNSHSKKVAYFYIINYFLRAIEQFTKIKSREYHALDAIDTSIMNIEIAINALEEISKEGAFDKIEARDYDTDFKDYIVRLKKTGFMTDKQLDNLTTLMDDFYLILKKYRQWEKQSET